jgi:hypothetical protein
LQRKSQTTNQQKTRDIQQTTQSQRPHIYPKPSFISSCVRSFYPFIYLFFVVVVVVLVILEKKKQTPRGFLLSESLSGGQREITSEWTVKHNEKKKRTRRWKKKNLKRDEWYHGYIATH